MRLESDVRLHGRRERVWAAILDPALLAHVVPGVRELRRVGQNEYRGRLVVGVGPLRAGAFEVRVRLRDLDPPRSGVVEVDGDGEAGSARGSGRFELEETRPSTTRLRYRAELELGGRLGRAPRLLLEPAVKALARQGLAALDRALRVRAATGEP